MNDDSKKSWWNQPYDTSNKKDKLLVWLISLTWGGVIPLAVILTYVYLIWGFK